MFYHFFMTYQLEHEQAEPTRVAGPFSASSSHREPVTEHQGPVREAEKLRNRLREGGGREGGKLVAFHRAKSKTLLARAWPIPPPSHQVGAAPCPQPGLGQAPQEKGDLWKRSICLGCPAATFGWDHLSRVPALELVLDHCSEGRQTAPSTQLGWLCSCNACKSVCKYVLPLDSEKHQDSSE